MSSLKSLNPKAEVMGRHAALFMNINASKGLLDVMKTNLGPKGTIKMLVGGAGGASRWHTRRFCKRGPSHCIYYCKAQKLALLHQMMSSRLYCVRPHPRFILPLLLHIHSDAGAGMMVQISS